MINEQFSSFSNRHLLNDKFYGIIPAKVTNNVDKEKLGRVEVTFEFSTNKTQVVTAWARLLAFSTGEASGSHFLPSVESEVIISFLGGNIRNPCIIGSLTNGKYKQPKETEGNSKLSIIKSSSGGALIFDDDDEKKILALQNEESKLKIILNSKSKIIEIESTDGVITITGGKDIKIETKENITIKGKDISILGEGNLKLEGKKITLEASEDLSLAGANITATAKSNYDMKGTEISVKGSGPVNIKGSKISMN